MHAGGDCGYVHYLIIPILYFTGMNVLGVMCAINMSCHVIIANVIFFISEHCMCDNIHVYIFVLICIVFICIFRSGSHYITFGLLSQYHLKHFVFSTCLSSHFNKCQGSFTCLLGGICYRYITMRYFIH